MFASVHACIVSTKPLDRKAEPNAKYYVLRNDSFSRDHYLLIVMQSIQISACGLVCKYEVPSGNRLHNYGKSLFVMGKSMISMAIFKFANC